MSLRYNVVTLLVCLLLPLTAAGEIYKWTDADGNVHYGSSPPVDQQTETVKPPPSGDTEAAQKSLQQSREILQPPEKKNKDAEKKKTAEAEQDPEAKKKRCEAAKKALEQMRTANRLQYIDDQGERAYMTPEQRAEREKKAQEMVKESCQ